MQETNNQQIKIIEAWLGVGLVVILVAVFLFLTKGEGGFVEGEKVVDTATTTEKLVYASDLLQSHTEKLEQLKGEKDYDELKKKLDQELVQTIEDKIKYTPGNDKPFDISDSYTEAQYKLDFAKLFGKATSSGMGLELVYFLAQIDPQTGALMPFAPQDVESIYRTATEYELFADSVQKLKTPTSLEVVGEVTTGKAREAAFYLKKMMEEQDPLVYSAMFERYTEATGYILKLNGKQTQQLNDLEQINALASRTDIFLKR